MTYIKSTPSSIKFVAAAFWAIALLLSAAYAPAFIVTVALFGMLHFAFLILDPVPLPIVLGLSGMITLTIFIAAMNSTPIS